MVCSKLYLPSAPPAQAELDPKPRYNVAPSQNVQVVRLEKDGQREIAMLRWGLIPSWASDPKIGYKMINARAETVATAPSFLEETRRRQQAAVPDRHA